MAKPNKKPGFFAALLNWLLSVFSPGTKATSTPSATASSGASGGSTTPGYVAEHSAGNTTHAVATYNTADPTAADQTAAEVSREFNSQLQHVALGTQETDQRFLTILTCWEAALENRGAAKQATEIAGIKSKLSQLPLGTDEFSDKAETAKGKCTAIQNSVVGDDLFSKATAEARHNLSPEGQAKAQANKAQQQRENETAVGYEQQRTVRSLSPEEELQAHRSRTMQGPAAPTKR